MILSFLIPSCEINERTFNTYQVTQSIPLVLFDKRKIISRRFPPSISVLTPAQWVIRWSKLTPFIVPSREKSFPQLNPGNNLRLVDFKNFLPD